MKDLNELMQAILDMDAAQRRATAAEQAQRGRLLDEMPARKAAIAQSYDQDAKNRAQQNAAVQRTKTDAAAAELTGRQAAAARTLQEQAAAHRAEWAKTLAQRALEQ